MNCKFCKTETVQQVPYKHIYPLWKPYFCDNCNVFFDEINSDVYFLIDKRFLVCNLYRAITDHHRVMVSDILQSSKYNVTEYIFNYKTNLQNYTPQQARKLYNKLKKLKHFE